jgi:hypothetical protein
MMFGLLITENSGGFIMKKSSLYFIYMLLFAILASVAENLIVMAIATAGLLMFTVAAIVMYYIENKSN